MSIPQLKIVNRDYIEFNSDILLRRESVPLLSQIDTAIFDVDGVLMEVTISLREAVSATVQFFFANIMNFTGDELLVRTEEIPAFKLAGGFNNDMYIVQAATLLYLYKSVKYETINMNELRAREPSLGECIKFIEAEGRGLAAARKAIFDRCSIEERERIDEYWKLELLKKLFYEHYLGKDKFECCMKEKAEYIKGRGFMDKETILLDPSVPKRLRAKGIDKFGIITGRLRCEFELAAEKIPFLRTIPPDYAITEDMNLHKPKPDSLFILVDKLGSKKGGVYVGDTLDDLLLVKNFQKERSADQPFFLSALVLSGQGGRDSGDFFRKKGADLIMENVNKLAEVLEDKR